MSANGLCVQPILPVAGCSVDYTKALVEGRKRGDSKRRFQWTEPDHAYSSVIRYGGMIISEVGAHPVVRSLVYVAAVQPEVGESAGGLQNKTPPASNSVVPVGGGFVQVKPAAFPEDFAADVPKPLAHFMAISQVPIAVEIFGAKATAAAWSKKASYAVIAKQDRMINPDLERFMAGRAKSETIELPGSHAIFLSHPKEVAALIEKAAKASE